MNRVGGSRRFAAAPAIEVPSIVGRRDAGRQAVRRVRDVLTTLDA